MKYILLFLLTLPIFAQTIEKPEPDQQDPKDKTNLTQAERRMLKKWEFSLGYGEANHDFSPTLGFLNLNLEYNWTSRFSIGYSQLHKQSFSTTPFIYTSLSVLEETNSREVGLLNFRYYFFEKFPLYITGGFGRDWISSYKSVEYQYAQTYDNNGKYYNSPIIRERKTLPANYKFFGLGFQWIFQNGFFFGLEINTLQSRSTTRSSSIILDKNYTEYGLLVAMMQNSDYKEKLDTDFKIIRLGYSLSF